MRAMRLVRFGSYSIAATVPGTPILFCLKSITLNKRLCQPSRPWRPEEIRPLLSRPYDFLKPCLCDFKGSISVNIEKSYPCICRLDGVVGLYCFTTGI